MTTKAFLNPYAFAVSAVLVAGLGIKFGRLLRLVLADRWMTAAALPGQGAAPSYWLAFRQAISTPIGRFHSRANITWTRGYAFYHIAIILLLLGYAASALILAGKVLTGQPVPDMSSGQVSSESYTPANLLAIIFGNAETLQRNFLFGIYAPVFFVLTWAEVACAVFGNCCLLLTLLGRRCGAVRGDLDDSARGVRMPGGFSWQHLAVRLIIFTIIWMEVLGRFDLVPGLVYLHALAGLTLLVLLPFVYLRHIVFVPLALSMAIRRRRAGRVV